MSLKIACVRNRYAHDVIVCVRTKFVCMKVSISAHVCSMFLTNSCMCCFHVCVDSMHLLA